MNCKPGDLAYIVEGPSENLGKVVEVKSGFGFYKDEGYCWNIVCRSKLVAIGEIDGKVHRVKEGFIPDKSLRPISGVPLDDETPVAVNLPEAFKLALGIEMRAWA
ncbi:hypothetical protein [Caballeronia sp. LZ001]|uniref:hypothetical protein n=1 Tax=Caballeronia sp. LZ001 TaxID=3038553 RepID=UPI0028596BC8|nr:hypothetical protein [Caballeronia sp. LZ001]MDR5801187.1 hypothetical protein [Caballeronia sp. LZ001]